jgi:hypothetical protein
MWPIAHLARPSAIDVASTLPVNGLCAVEMNPETTCEADPFSLAKSAYSIGMMRLSEVKIK